LVLRKRTMTSASKSKAATNTGVPCTRPVAHENSGTYARGGPFAFELP
jgi:hypothetical protein